MKTILSFLSLLSFSLVFGQASPVLKNQRIDFERFQQAFYKIEAQPFLHFEEPQLEADLKELREKLRSPLSPVEQFRLYSELIAKIQCGHTSVLPSKKAIREWGSMKQCLPFDVVMVNKKLFIAPTHPDDIPKPKKGEKVVKEKQKKAREILKGGTQIYAIDKKSIDEWMKLISPYVSSDENGIDFKYFVAGQVFDFYRYIALPTNKDSVEIRYIYKKDTLSQYVKLGYPMIHTINERLDPKINKKKEKEFGTFSIEKNKYGYFRFESFKNAKGKKYEEFLQTSFESMKKKKIDKLVIDLRGNTGGVIQVELLRYLIPSGTPLGKYKFEKKFSRGKLRKMGIKMNDEATKIYLKNMRTSKKIAQRMPDYDGEMTVPANLPNMFKGEIVVITDEGTFSAASVLACHLKTLKEAKIIGETPGGSFYAGNAGTLPLKLKKSKMIIQVNPNFFCSQIYPSSADPAEIKKPDVVLFSEIQVPGEKYVKIKKKKKPTEDPILKVAEKQLK